MTVKTKISSIRRRLLKCASAVAVALFFLSGLMYRCASPMSPTGGPRDSLPPVVVEMEPAYGTVDFAKKKIYVEFDEYVKLVDLQKEFFVSPFMKRKPSVTPRGRGIQIDIQDTLAENTTYAFNFGSAIRDNNEGNALHGFRYVFSTGGNIDSMIMSGYTADGYRGDSVGNVFILFYPDAEHPLAEGYDSTLFNVSASAVGRSNPNGTFIAQNLKPVNYRVYAMQDANNNQTYEPGTDRVAFLDSTVNPLSMPAFDIWYDTLRRYPVPQPQLLLRLFMDKGFKRQYLVANKRTMKQKVELHFNTRYPVIDTLRFDGIADSSIIREYPTEGRDTLFLWFDMPPEEMPDTLLGRISYLRHDSVGELVPAGQNLKLGWFEREETREEKKAREELEKEIEQAIARGEKPPRRPNPFKYQVQASSELNPENDIVFEFEYPMLSIDSQRIELVRIDGQKMFDVKFDLRRDSVNIRRWTLSAPWIADQSYSLTIPAGAFTDIARRSNDTLRSEFKVAAPEKYCTLNVNITGKTPESQYVIQILSTSGGLLKEIAHATTGRHVFRYLAPGMVKMRVIEDTDGNGRWDGGDLIKRIQPERVALFVDTQGSEEIETRMGWEKDVDIDMNRMFAPMTMDALVRQLEVREAVRRLKWLKEQEHNRTPKSSTRQSQESQRSGDDGSVGGVFGGDNRFPSLPGFNRR